MYKKTFYISFVLVGISGCGFPFRCESERIEVSLPAVIERGTAREEAALSGAVAPSNVGVDIFADLKSVLIEKPAAPSSGIVWSVPAFNTNGGGLAVALRAPIVAGEVIPVASSFQGGGWGRLDLPENVRVQVSVRAENFVATSASGTVEVLGVAPLRLRMDLAGTNDANETIRLRGDASFKFERERVPCE